MFSSESTSYKNASLLRLICAIEGQNMKKTYHSNLFSCKCCVHYKTYFDTIIIHWLKKKNTHTATIMDMMHNAFLRN